MKIKDRKNNTPFDTTIKSEAGASALSAKHVRPARFMTTRSAVFMGLTILSLCFAIACDNNYVTAGFMLLICCAFYSVTFRFLRFSNALLNGLFFIFCPMICWGVYFADINLLKYIPETLRPLFQMSPVFPLCFIPMATGFAVLSVVSPDGKEDNERPLVFKEIVQPAFFAAVSSSIGSFIAGLPERRTVFLATLLSVLLLIGLSAMISALTKSPWFFTSKRLTEYWDIPVADMSELRRFFFARLKFIIVLFITDAVLYLLYYFFGKMMVPYVMPVAVFTSVILGIAMVAAGRPADIDSLFGTKLYLFGIIMGAAFISVPFARCEEFEPQLMLLGLFLFFACAGDFLVSGLISVIRRRQIFVEKNKYTDGLPFMMIMLSLLIMAAEAMFPVI